MITVAVRWYLRYGLSYRDVEELLCERGVDVDHVTIYRWVQRFTPLIADAARPLRHATGDRWFLDETYVKVAGRWRYLYRAVDQYGQVIDVPLTKQRDTAAARRFFTRALRHGAAPVEVTTDKAGPYLRVLDQLVPDAAHVTEQYANNWIEADHGRLKARLRPMRGPKRLRGVCCIGRGQALTVIPDRGGWGVRRCRTARSHVDRSAFAGFRFPPEVITVAVRWYLRYGLSYRDVEELLAERGIEVDHVTIYRWVQRFTPLFADGARPPRHATGDRWFVDETYVKVAGRWRYLYRAVDQYGQVIDVLLTEHRDTAAARRFFARALRHGPVPVEVTTDKAPAYLRVLDELAPAALHVTEQYANNRIEADHGRLKARLRPMRGLKRFRSAAVIAGGHAFVQNLRRGHYELATDVPPLHRLTAAFAELAVAL